MFIVTLGVDPCADVVDELTHGRNMYFEPVQRGAYGDRQQVVNTCWCIIRIQREHNGSLRVIVLIVNEVLITNVLIVIVTAVQDKASVAGSPLIYAAFKWVNVSFEVCAPVCCPNHAKSKTVWLAASSGSGGIAKG